MVNLNKKSLTFILYDWATSPITTIHTTFIFSVYFVEKIAVEKLKHFISKEALNIEGLGKKVIEKFWELRLIRKPQDIFNLDYYKIKKWII